MKAWDPPLRCSNCGRDSPESGLPYRCPHCGGHFELPGPLPYDPQPGTGVHRYRHSFPLPAEAELVSLGEGGTPLLADEVHGREVFFKCEYLNPTGSFKDRGTAVLISALKAAGVEQAVEDSSGNAGASFAAYASRAGIRARVFVPDYASGPKRAQIEIYGAELVRILGPRSETTAAVLREADAGAVYASHAFLPQGLAGMATMAFELYETLGQAPGALVTPVGQGTMLLGAQMGFEALREAGHIDRLPRLIGVQAQACAPLWLVHSGGAAALAVLQEGNTLAEGIRILRPLRGDRVLTAVETTGGTFAAVEEHEIKEGLAALARRGMLVEPTSAVVWPALLNLLDRLPDPVVVVLTGSGFKSGPAAWPKGEQAGSAERTGSL